MAKYQVRWTGSTPLKCEICETPIDKVFYDARTVFGPWAKVGECCFKKCCRGTGTGRGQKFEKQDDGQWRKTEG